ncbi:hypothetical protein NOVOSPHI9U_400005 [Novosphingobium sp. 9U]|nr:hypothetical protein NOVOSPHI9U_400005 [Novosphingobium sp. 9U]
MIYSKERANLEDRMKYHDQKIDSLKRPLREAQLGRPPLWDWERIRVLRRLLNREHEKLQSVISEYLSALPADDARQWLDQTCAESL